MRRKSATGIAKGSLVLQTGEVGMDLWGVVWSNLPAPAGPHRAGGTELCYDMSQYVIPYYVML